MGFKHHGNQVRDETLRRHNDVAVTLVDELVRAGFGVQLNDISMLIFVSHLGVREFIQKAESQHQANDLTGALSSLRSAFDLAVHDYVSRKSLNGWDTIFHVGPRMLTHHGGREWGWEKPLGEMTTWVEALDQRVRLLAVGVDLSRYAYFDAVAPEHADMWHNGRGPIVRVRFQGVTDDHYQASFMFVVDTAVRLSATDFNLAPLRNDARPAEAYDPKYRSERYLRQQEEDARFRVAREQKLENLKNDGADE